MTGETKFTWVKTHKEIAQYLLDKQNKQRELIELLKSVGISGFKDQEVEGENIDLTEIDPFSFYCFIYKHGSEKRLEFLQKIARKLNFTVPTDELGIPSTNALKVMLFPYKFDRQNNEIDRLWKFFYSAMDESITDDQFKNILSIKGTGITKITEILYYINPEKYFPINNPTKPMLKEVFSINPKFKTYSEYENILKQLKNKTDKPFYQLSYDSWGLKTNYWVFQVNPKIYDIVGSIRDKKLNTWSVQSHKEKIKAGDKVILWVTGDNPGCYALCEVTSDVYYATDEVDQMKYYTDRSKNDPSDRVKIKITYDFSESPISKDVIDQNIKLSKLKAGLQGTNFAATKEEYDTIIELSNKESSDFEKIKSKFAKDDLNVYFSFLSEIISHFGLNKDDERIVFSSTYYGLNFTVGQRYCWNLFVSEPKGRFGVISKEKINSQSSSFDRKKPIPFYTNFDKIRFSEEMKSNIFSGIESELKRTKKSSFRKYNNSDFENAAFMYQKESSPVLNIPLNLILYGAPGTGKTYRVKNEYSNLFTDQEGTQTKQDFCIELTKNLAWWEVISIVVLDLKKANVQEIFNHPLLQAKISISNNKTPKNTIWSWLQRHTKDDCLRVNFTKRDSPQFFWKDENSYWTIDEDIVESDTPEFYDLLKQYKEFKPITKTIRRYKFITFHQSYSYEDFVEGIKPIISDDSTSEEGKTVIYDIQDGVFKNSVNEAKNDPNNNYALFIDEINRGNIANIFGELITLIEEDKRIGAENYIPIQLPYSKEEFGVPKNLYIIGTMNTADRSVEALDTALRRRFSFIEMNPQPQKLENDKFKCEGIDLSKLLTVINARIEKLLDQDYCIGHSYFMTIKDRQNPLNEIKDIFRDKILPLLQEYFYGDWGKIMLILGDQFVIKSKDKVAFKSTNQYDDFDSYDEKPIYRFTDYQKWTIDTFKSIYE